MPKFYVELDGTVSVKWGIEVEATTVDIAEQEALDSAPRYEPMSWKLGTEVVGINVEEVDTLPDEPRDIDMGRRELEMKYSQDGKDWGHHPLHTRELWKHCVTEEDTVSGYWDWVYEKIQNEDEPDEAH